MLFTESVIDIFPNVLNPLIGHRNFFFLFSACSMAANRVSPLPRNLTNRVQRCVPNLLPGAYAPFAASSEALSTPVRNSPVVLN